MERANTGLAFLSPFGSAPLGWHLSERFQEPTRQIPLAVRSAGADQKLMGDDGTEDDPR